MKVLICPDKFKGSLPAIEVARAIGLGIKRYDSSIETVLHPLADGGDGSVDLVNEYLNLDVITLSVYDPLGREIRASYAFGYGIALIEMASASGLHLMKGDRLDIMKASSYGTGQMIADAVQKGAEKIFLFIGGSATNDGGIGMAAACGYEFMDEQNQLLQPNGSALNAIQRIESNHVIRGLSDVEFFTVCDVDNPFYGANGAAHVYASQKGASEDEILILDNGLNQLASVMNHHFGIDVSNFPGAGAAGGVGGGSMAFFNASLKQGINTIMDLTNFDRFLNGVNLAISGEGRADHQSLYGKVISGVASRLWDKGIPLALVVGKNELSSKDQAKLKIVTIKDVMSRVASLKEAITHAPSIIAELSFQLIKEWSEQV